MIDRLSLV